jgi:subtilisin family serine protease
MFRSIRYFAGVAIVAALVAIPFLISSAGTTDKTVAVIVQLRDEPAAVYEARAEQSGGALSADQLQAYRGQLAGKQTDFLNALTANGVSYSVATRAIKGFDGNVAGTIALRYTLVLNGVVLNVPSSAIGAIRSMPQVKSVSPDETLATDLNNSVPYIRAPQVYGDGDETEVSKKGYAASGSDNVGQGVNVAVIDTGIDWTHPMFGGDANPPRLGILPDGVNGGGTGSDNFNKKVIYYIPFTDIAVEDGFGHGTHVASTIAGYWQQLLTGERIHGVAPQAKIMSYKVCSDIESTVSQVQPIGGCDSANIIMALEDSVSPTTLPTIQGPNGAVSNPATALFPKPIAKVINMSLGGGGGPDNPTAIAASNAALAGAVVVAASGNSGPGEGTTGSPAAGTHVISVGATTHPGSAGSVWSSDLLQANAVSVNQLGAVSPANQFATVAGNRRLRLFAESGSAPVPAGGLAQHYVFVLNPLVTWPASVRGRIALVKDALGATNFDVALQAANAGAVGLIVSDNRGAVNGIKTIIPAATIMPDDFEVLSDALSSTDDNSVDPANGAISELPVRMNPTFSDTFMGEMAGFSSRGPVRGFGQVKPDISAPGVQVLAACPPASLLGALAAVASPTTPNYIRIDGTSMATPHTAGAAALIRQAHRTWKPDVVRTVLINTATNMRDQSGGAKADGLGNDNILSQGGGLIDVFHAVNAKAIMGVTGDGITTPGILGSYSYGEVPVANTRISYTAPVTVTVRDLTGDGGTYNLNIANNRDLQLDGISVSLSQASVSLPANGSTTFTVNATFDGDLLRDSTTPEAVVINNSVQFIPRPIQMQWFVTATRSDNKESLRMPFYFKPGPSLPAQPIIETLNQTATVPAASAGQQLISGVDYVDVPFDVSDSTFKIDATVEWFTLPTGSLQDIDYELLDPDGNVIASSGNGAGASESVSIRVTRGGTYKHRLIGFTNAATDVTITTVMSKGPAAPTASSFTGDFVDSSGNQVDFDGSVNLQWTPTGGELSYEIEHSLSGGDWELLATADASATSFAVNNLPDGTHSFRLRGLHQGQIGKYVTPAGSAVSVLVSARTKVDITSLVDYPVSNFTCCSGGIAQLDVNLKSKSSQTYVPFVDFNVIRITSTTGTVRVKNADNGKTGLDPANPALFKFTDQLGADQLFRPNETTGARTIQFYNNGEMASWDVLVTAYVGTNPPPGESGASAGSSSSSGSASDPTGLLSLTKVTAVMRFTYNPLTKTVTKQLVSLK